MSATLPPKDVHVASSTKELSELSKIPPLDHKIDIKKYVRSAFSILQQGRIYQLEGDLENAYILFMRYASLVIEQLPKHRGYSTLTEKSLIKKQALQVLGDIEELKKKLEQMYEQKRKQEEEAEKQRILQQQQKEQQEQQQNAPIFPSIPMNDPPTGQLSDLQKSFEEQQKQAYQNFSKEEAQPEQQQQLYQSLNPDDYRKDDGPIYTPSQRPSMNMDDTPPNLNNYYTAPPASAPPPAYMAPNTMRAPVFGGVPLPGFPPSYPVYNQPPPQQVTPTAPMAPPPTTVQPTAPPPQVAPKEVNGMRRIMMDGEMFTKFMDIAKPNTDKKTETCGILAGTLRQNVFYVTTLIVPKQHGTPDTCAMTHEDEVFMYQTEHNLMTLGWIHTHPTQECFLSSVDLHTHSGYQFLLKEAVAVVIAPKFTPNFGIFSLTDLGLSTIQTCERKGFHPHEKGLYNTCSHVTVNWENPTYTIADLRKS